MDPLEDLFAEGAVKTARAVGKFQPKAKPRPVKKGPVAAAAAPSDPSAQSIQLGDADKCGVLKAGQLTTKESSVPSSEPLASNVPKGDGEEQFAIPATLPAGNQATVSNIPGAQNSEVSAAQCPLTSEEPIVSTREGVSQIDSIDLGIEGIETYPCLETPDGPELATISGRSTGKFQPKPNVQFTKNCNTGIPNSCAHDPQSTDFVDKERLPALYDDVLDLSSLGFDCALPTGSTSEVPVNEEMPNIDADFPVERPGNSSRNEDGNNDEEFQVEKKRARRKSKKNVGDEEKPARKRKKAIDKTDQATKEKPKKFSHTTRQKRRTLDKVLLETPEDEINYERVPIKDLILLAEHKERIAKKDAVSQTPQPQVNPSGNSPELNNEEERFNSSEWNNEEGRFNSSEWNNEDERFTFDEDEDGEAFGEQATTQVADTPYFNYQTYMEKTPRVRWSKEDTELFYEAIRQFGSDFSMIQQLFPGRTRTQVRLKYKKEEQRHPSRIHDALTNRAKDHSHFEQVIARLKQIAAEENQNDDDMDESIDLMGEEEVEGQKEEPMSEHVEETEAQDMEQDVTQVHSPVHEEDEEDEDIWSQYKSEL